MSYSKTISSGKDIAFVHISGWTKPGVVFSTEKIHEILKELKIIGDDMISSKEGIAGQTLHSIEEELNALLRGCESISKENDN